MTLPSSLLTNLDKLTYDAFGGYEYVQQLTTQEELEYILNFPGPRLTINPRAPLINLGQFGKSQNTPYSVLDKKFSLFYNVSGQQTFGQDVRDRAVILSTPHGGYFHVAFDTPDGHQIVLFWVAKELPVHKQRNIIDIYKQRREPFIQTNKVRGEVFLINDFDDAQLNIYFMPGVLKNGVGLQDVLSSSSSTLLVQSTQREVNLFPKYNGWYALVLIREDSVIPASLTNIKGLGVTKIQKINALTYISLDSVGIDTLSLDFDSSENYDQDNGLSVTAELVEGISTFLYTHSSQDTVDITYSDGLSIQNSVKASVAVGDGVVIDITESTILVTLVTESIAVDDVEDVTTTETIDTFANLLTTVDGGSLGVEEEELIVFTYEIFSLTILGAEFVDAEAETVEDLESVSITYVITDLATYLTTITESETVEDLVVIDTTDSTDTNFWLTIEYYHIDQDTVLILAGVGDEGWVFIYIDENEVVDPIESVTTTEIIATNIWTTVDGGTLTVDEPEVTIDTTEQIVNLTDYATILLSQYFTNTEIAPVSATPNIVAASSDYVIEVALVDPTALVINTTEQIVLRDDYIVGFVEPIVQVEDSVLIQIGHITATGIWTTVEESEVVSFDQTIVTIETFETRSSIGTVIRSLYRVVPSDVVVIETEMSVTTFNFTKVFSDHVVDFGPTWIVHFYSITRDLLSYVNVSVEVTPTKLNNIYPSIFMRHPRVVNRIHISSPDSVVVYATPYPGLSPFPRRTGSGQIVSITDEDVIVPGGLYIGEVWWDQGECIDTILIDAETHDVRQVYAGPTTIIDTKPGEFDSYVTIIGYEIYGAQNKVEIVYDAEKIIVDNIRIINTPSLFASVTDSVRIEDWRGEITTYDAIDIYKQEIIGEDPINISVGYMIINMWNIDPLEENFIVEVTIVHEDEESTSTTESILTLDIDFIVTYNTSETVTLTDDPLTVETTEIIVNRVAQDPPDSVTDDVVIETDTYEILDIIDQTIDPVDITDSIDADNYLVLQLIFEGHVLNTITTINTDNYIITT